MPRKRSNRSARVIRQSRQTTSHASVDLCPRCLTTRLRREIICGYCGDDIRLYVSTTFDVTLIRALTDAEPETVIRAVFLLGVRHPTGAAEALLDVYRTHPNVFVRRHAIAALDAIGGDDALRVLQEAAVDASIVLRAEALGRLIEHEGASGAAAAAARSDPHPYVRWMTWRRSVLPASGT